MYFSFFKWFDMPCDILGNLVLHLVAQTILLEHLELSV